MKKEKILIRLWKSLLSTKDFRGREKSNSLNICYVQRAKLGTGEYRKEPRGSEKFYYQTYHSVGMKNPSFL